MPRGGGSRGGSRGSSRGGGFGGFGRSRSTTPPPRQAPTATRPMPAQMNSQTQQIPQRGGMFSGIGSTIMTGMAFGAGSEVAHQAVRSVIGGGSSQGQQVTEQQPQQQ